MILLFALAVPATVFSASYSSDNPEYSHARKLFWNKLYAGGGETLYCGEPFKHHDRRIMNIEHVLPMGWAMKKLGCTDRRSCRRTSQQFRRIEADMHNLYPARRDINHKRGSLPFGMVAGEYRRFGKCDFEIDYRRRKIEPRPAVRGDIARSVAYMHDRYGIKVFKRQQQLLRQWHEADPPDQHERNRNDLIEKMQGNRNPFIDHPEQLSVLFK